MLAAMERFYDETRKAYRCEQALIDFIDSCRSQDPPVTVADIRAGADDDAYDELVDLVDRYEALIGCSYDELPLSALEDRPIRNGARYVQDGTLDLDTAVAIFIGGWTGAIRRLPTWCWIRLTMQEEGMQFLAEDPRDWR